MVAENPGGIGQRHLLAFWLFTGLAIDYCLRFSIYVSIVAMVGRHGKQVVSDQKMPNGTCSLPSFANDSESIEKLTTGEFDWDHATQGYILSAFFYSYLVMMFPGGLLCKRFSAHILTGCSIGISSLLSLALPFCARLGPTVLIFNRIFHGMLAGVIYPACYQIVAAWVPEQEKTVFVSTAVFCGSSVGTVLSAQVSGLLCDYGFAGGWPSVFYVFGAVGFFWSIGWMFCVRDTPRKHPWIAEKELQYIEENCHVVNDNKSLSDVPWKRMFLSGPFWAFVAGHYSYNWAFYTTFATLPTYFKDVIHLPPTMNGFATSLPHIILTIAMSTTGIVADILRKYLSTRTVRIIYYDFGQIITGLFLLLIIYAKCNMIWVVIFLSTSFAGMGISINGWGINHLDIAPRFASIAMAFSNTLASIPGIFSPILTGYIINEQSNFETWTTVFLINGLVCALGALAFSLLADGNVQSWATTDKNNKTKDLIEEEKPVAISTSNLAVIEPLLEH